MFGKREEIKDIQCVEIHRTYSLKDKTIDVRIQNGMSGEVNGKREILDEVLINNMTDSIIQAVRQNHSKYNSIPNEIILRTSFYGNNDLQTQTEVETSEKQDNIGEQKIIDSYEPRFELKQVALNENVRGQIMTAISAVKHKKEMVEEWGMSEYFAGNRAIILNFYGKPGTGKSMAAEAVAKALDKKVYHINYSELESKYVGETPKNIRKAFEYATRDNAVLIFDEADSFLGKRLSSVTQSADYGVNITRSVLLMELERFDGVVVFTTNLISNYDEAFKRRILLNVYFEIPDEVTRVTIWKLHLNNKIPLHRDVTAEELAKRYDGISGADIKDIIFYAALFTLDNNKSYIGFSEFDYAYKIIKERYINHEKEREVSVISTEIITEEQYQGEVNM